MLLVPSAGRFGGCRSVAGHCRPPCRAALSLAYGTRPWTVRALRLLHSRECIPVALCPGQTAFLSGSGAPLVDCLCVPLPFSRAGAPARSFITAGAPPGLRPASRAPVALRTAFAQVFSVFARRVRGARDCPRLSGQGAACSFLRRRFPLSRRRVVPATVAPTGALRRGRMPCGAPGAENALRAPEFSVADSVLGAIVRLFL